MKTRWGGEREGKRGSHEQYKLEKRVVNEHIRGRTGRYQLVPTGMLLFNTLVITKP